MKLELAVPAGCSSSFKKVIHSSELELPFIKWLQQEGQLSLYLVCPAHPHCGKFFYDMITHWLWPGRRLHISTFFATESDRLLFSEALIRLQGEEQFHEIRGHLPILEAELRLGLPSQYHARKILEMKGFSADEKVSMIQEQIGQLVKRWPDAFDYDIFSLMQHFLVMCSDEFKAGRSTSHLARIASVFYLFRRTLEIETELKEGIRYLHVKCMKIRLQTPLGFRRALALFVGMNRLTENELFEEKHLLQGVITHVPGVALIPDSVCIDRGRGDLLDTLYVEVVKENGQDFTQEEIKLLRKVLPIDLKARVEKRQRPIFMPRNEEEVMRYILTLSQQLKYPRDIPQVVISFEGQTEAELLFTVILVRVLLADSPPIEAFQFQPDRVKRVGHLRKKYPKEASVFRIRLAQDPFLREDQSVDLFQARREVLRQLEAAVGEVRDYNGGMLSKQIEVLLELKKSFTDLDRRRGALIDHFFHSLFPIESRSLVKAGSLKGLFLLFEAAVDGKKRIYSTKGEEVFEVLVVCESLEHQQQIMTTVDGLQLLSSELVTLSLKHLERYYLGYLLFSEDEEVRNKLFSSLDF